MSCLDCGCDPWFELKNGLKQTTSSNCGCSCHKPYNSDGKFWSIAFDNEKIVISDDNEGIDLGEFK